MSSQLTADEIECNEPPAVCPFCGSSTIHKVKDSHDSLCRYECTSLWQTWKPFEQSVRCELNVANQQITQLQSDLQSKCERLEGELAAALTGEMNVYREQFRAIANDFVEREKRITERMAKWEQEASPSPYRPTGEEVERKLLDWLWEKPVGVIRTRSDIAAEARRIVEGKTNGN